MNTSIAIGDLDLSEEECAAIVELYNTLLDEMQKSRDGVPHYIRPTSIVNILMMKKMCQVLLDGDQRHPGYWPISLELASTYNHVPREINHYTEYTGWMPVTINGVTLPGQYADYFLQRLMGVQSRAKFMELNEKIFEEQSKYKDE